MSKKTIETWLPEFPGFYETGLNLANDADIEYNLFNDPDKVAPEIVEFFKNNVYDFIDFKTMEEAVAKHSCNFIADMIASILKTHVSIDFQMVVSPKQYNFSTDVVNCVITMDTEPVYEYLNSHLAEYTTYIKENYSSRSGFLSYYDTSMAIWLNPECVEQAHEFGSVLAFILQNEDKDNSLYSELCIYAQECVAIKDYIDMTGLYDKLKEVFEELDSSLLED